MYTEIYFLKKAGDLESAIRKTENILSGETYSSFWDGMEAVHEKCGSLEKKRIELERNCEQFNTVETAHVYLEKAENYMKAGDLVWAGYYYRKAGLLLEQNLSSDMVVFNMEEWDYSIPGNDDGWFVVCIDFHY
jgi:hypothetical protein